jgi:hypothetical protein
LRLAPYLLTVAVVAVLLRRYPIADIVREMSMGHAIRMLPLGIALPFTVWVPYAAYDRLVLKGVVGPIPLRDLVRVKAATALLLMLNYFIGGGGYAVWIARTTRSGPARAAGAILYIMASDLIAICAVAGTSMWLGGEGGATPLRSIATWAFAVLLSFIVFGPYGGWMRLPAVFEPWRTVPRGVALAQIVGRAGNIAIITGLTWLAMRAFGIAVPPAAAATYVPVIVFVTALPVNVAGLGVAQAAWLLLLPWATGPQLLAFQVLWQAFVGLGMLLRGIPFVRGVTREIEEGKAAAAR